MKGKPTRGSPFFGAFPSDRIPKATKDASVLLFIQFSSGNNLVYYTTEFRALSVAATCNYMFRDSPTQFNPLNAKLNPFCHLVALLGGHHILHVSRIRVK